jgi:hypothetical protein
VFGFKAKFGKVNVFTPLFRVSFQSMRLAGAVPSFATTTSRASPSLSAFDMVTLYPAVEAPETGWLLVVVVVLTPACDDVDVGWALAVSNPIWNGASLVEDICPMPAGMPSANPFCVVVPDVDIDWAKAEHVIEKMTIMQIIEYIYFISFTISTSFPQSLAGMTE